MAPSVDLADHLGRVGLAYNRIHNPNAMYSTNLSKDPHTSPLHNFTANLTILIQSLTSDTLTFDLLHVDAPIANALRRVMLADVPTVAIEHVFVHSNTSIMHDEQLAHRLGLVPLKIDPSLLHPWRKGDPVTASNTVKFELDVECKFNPNAPSDGLVDPKFLYSNYQMLSGDLKYLPMPGQHFPTAPKPAFGDIVLAKLRPPQHVKLVLHATKHSGREHAKWSPCATAWYRLNPCVDIVSQPDEDTAKEIVQLCPANVFDIEDEKLVAKRPRDCTSCRECIRMPSTRDYVKLSRRRDHFIFQVESDGSLPPARIVMDALDVLINKCDTLRGAFDNAMERRNVAA